MSKKRDLSDVEAQCGWCNAVRIAGTWHPFDERLPVTHGICEDCVRKVFPQHAEKILERSEDAEENAIPLGMPAKKWHEHPMHGWIDPDGRFYFAEAHYPWASEFLGKPYIGDYEYWELINQGWYAVGPGRATGKKAPNRKQFETIQNLVMEHAGGTPWMYEFFDVETGHDVNNPSYTVYRATHADFVESPSWSSFAKYALRERSSA